MRHLIVDWKQWSPGKTFLSILGPTASGKTDLAQSIASTIVENGLKKPLLVSVDAVSVYSELNIGSAKPSEQERKQFDWCGLDLIACNETISAFAFLSAVQPLIQTALDEGRPVIFAGGSFFYERILVAGPMKGQASDPAYLKNLGDRSVGSVYEELCVKDLRIREMFSANDQYRVFRYADLMLRQGLSLDSIRNPVSPFPIDTQTLIVGAETKPDVHYLRRIDKMLERGWLEEVQSLLKTFGPGCPGLKSVGYLQLVEHLQSASSLDDARLEILRAHKQLAKKQRTWLRGLQRQQIK